MISDRLLGTKCCVPRLPDPLIGRPRLEKLLVDGTRRPVTLVSGPPGAGKTTLLASWLATTAPAQAAWLTVDGRDNEPGRLDTLIAAVLAEAGCIEGRGGQGPDGLDAAFGDIRRHARPCVLVLDDVQELRSGAALDTLAHVVRRPPESLDVVLACRADPAVGLEGLRVDGRLAEVRYTDLCFSPAEAAELFDAHSLTLSESQTRALWELVEGWAAGLRLAAAAVQSEPEPAVLAASAPAARAAAVDYLFGEVLAGEDRPAEDFLLRTSVAERLTPDLAVALTGDPRSGKRLADLRRSGLFLVEPDDRQCYRHQGSFRTLLHARLRQRKPDLAEQLHRRAAAWWLAHGSTADAEAHARAGADWPLVGRLLLLRWLVGTTEESDPFATDPLDGVPPAAAMETPALALVAAAEACRWANRNDADLYRSRADRTRPGPPGAGDDADNEVRQTARHLLDLTFGWTFGADERARSAVDAVRDLDAAEPWTPRLRQLAVLAEAEMDIDAGHLDRARHHLDALAGGEPHWHRVLATAVLALLDAAAGDVRSAEDRLAWVTARLDARPGHPATARFARAATALCTAQLGESATGEPGEPAEWSSASLRCVDRVIQAATRGRAPFFVSLDRPIARHPLAQRALVALGVLEVVDAGGHPVPVGGHAERALAAARAQLAGTEIPGAPAGDRLDGPDLRHPRTAVEAATLGAVFAERRGDHAEAERLTREAIGVSDATGIRAPILDHGRHLLGVLERIVDDPDAPGPVGREILAKLQNRAADRLVQPLTDREVDVLQLLPSLMSNAEIARDLGVSVNTVKTHLKSVYRKLDVDCRREAVQRGRVLDLL